MKCKMMHDVMQKKKTHFFIEGLVKVIVNIIRNIAPFDNFEILQTIPLRAKAKSRKETPTKAKVWIRLFENVFLCVPFTRFILLMFIKTY
jgi:glycopeptide antibiotics resistance protein